MKTLAKGKVAFDLPRLLATGLAVAITLAVPLSLGAQTANSQPAAAAAGDSNGSGTAAAQVPAYPTPLQQYPGQKPESGKLQATVGPVKVRFYGTLILNASGTDSVEVGQDVPLWPLPGSIPLTFPDGTSVPAGHLHDTIFTARQSIIGFNLSPASPVSGWNPSAVVEIDFFGSRPSDGLQPQGRVFNQPRLRLGYLQLQKGMWKIIAGQDNIIISPLDPVSLSHVAVPLGATAGDLWGRLPQVRVEVSNSFGETSTLFQIGVLRPEFADPRLSDLPVSGSAVDAAFSGFGARSASPFYQARFAVSHPAAGSTMTVGLGGHYGKEKVGANHDVNSWAGTVDAELPLQSRLMLRGEGFVGSNLVAFQGGILQGVAAAPATAPFKTIRPIDSHGGWGELTIKATEDNANIFYLGAGTDNPRASQLLPGTNRGQNTVSWISYFRALTSSVTLALEWSNWQFRTKNFVNGVPGPKGPSGRGNVFNVSLAYRF